MKVNLVVGWECRRCGKEGRLSEEEVALGNIDNYEDLIDAQHKEVSPDCEGKTSRLETRIKKKPKPIEVELVGSIER